MTTIDFTRTQNPLSSGGFLADPFLEANNPLTSTPLAKPTKCVSDGTLAGAIIGTLILSAFAAFLSWLIYLRPKFQELHERQAYDKFHAKFSSSSREHPKQRPQTKAYDNHGSDLPLDAIDYKFGTFPFRQSQISQNNHHHHHHGQDWLNRISTSFRSMNLNPNVEMLDIELLDPTFGGLNFNITGSMKAGIFIKDIIDGHDTEADNQLKTGDRIMALTICFESIVYEDALTILSYASPYPVVLRVQRVIDSSRVKTVHETRQLGTNRSTSKVKWREEFEHYDNDSRSKYSFIHSAAPNQKDQSPPLPIRDKPHIAMLTSSTLQPRSSTKRASSRMNTKTSTTQSVNRNPKMKTSSNSALATATRHNNDRNKNVSKMKSTHANGMSLDRRSTQKTIMTSIETTTSIHERARQEKRDIDRPYASEERLSPHYDSPYDCFDDQIETQYQYLHQSHLNRNNNNSRSMESLTLVTPCPSRSIHSLSVLRPFDRHASSPAAFLSSISSQRTNKDWNDISLNHTDTFV